MSPKRVVPRFQALSPDEVADLWCAALPYPSMATSCYPSLATTPHARTRVLSTPHTCLHKHRERARATCLQPGGAQTLAVSPPLRCMGRRVLAQRVGGVVEPHFSATSLTLTVQVTGSFPRRPCPPVEPGPARSTSTEFGRSRQIP